jgi:pimeloyl-ACP methyl ester carboxylesterase
VLAYELLTGELPFKGNGPAGLLAAIASGRYEALSDRRAGGSHALAALIGRCLEVEPAARFATGKELATALHEALNDHATGRQPAASVGSVQIPIAQEQQIRFATTSDGVSIAYSVVGSGPAIVRVLGHFTHLEMDWEWPELRRFWECLAEQHAVVRYDGRGMGLSEPYSGEFTEETRQLDLEAVLAAVDAERVVLLGISEGGWTAAMYAIQHPRLVTHLVLYGAYCRGALARPGYDAEEDEALVTLIRKGWGRDTPAFRQVFTSQFFRPDADPRLIAHFNELQRVSADPETAARYYSGLHTRGDGRDLFRQIRTPTLVLHCRDDLAVSAEEGRLLASTVPGAQLVMLPSGTHYFPTDADVVAKATGAIDRFLRASDARS